MGLETVQKKYGESNQSCNDPAKKGKIKWTGSAGRERLKQEIIAGSVHEMSDPAEVHQRHDDYTIFPLNQFKTNLESLLEQIINEFERFEVDAEAYGHDIAIILATRTDMPEKRPWHRSPCKELLEKLVKEGKHLEIDPETEQKIKPKAIYQSDCKFREFSLKVFRNHLYQEADKQAKKDRPRKKTQKKRARRSRADRVVEEAHHLLNRVDRPEA
ncbi:expressed unknown protein [Seminavis robusta]|uniref:Uncharacterized protein n=1 Tax=Seminavis robusta TaxID=568900 RepID=A0A9N8F119_9STRA|nr:expressed unknown protein [Seminavis robusta]|eukprot:Sro2988_g341710.1 n/a (215) ;mRNA; f:280-924